MRLTLARVVRSRAEKSPDRKGLRSDGFVKLYRQSM